MSRAACDQVVVGDIPRQRPGFQPRPGLLARLNQTGRDAPVAQVLTGKPGAGKTWLAGAYARAKVAAGWRLIAWVNAENPGSLLAGLTAVTNAIGLSGHGSGHEMATAGQLVRDWLEADGDRCLLVFDDARDPDVLQPFVPVGGAAQVLITSTEHAVADLGTSVLVDVFGAAEALAFLEGRTGQSDEAGASALAAELGFLPLALDQAAAVIAEHHLGCGTYLERLRTLPVKEYLVHRPEQLYPSGVAEVVLLSLERVRASDQWGVSTRLLEIIAVLSTAGVGRELLHAAGQAGVLDERRQSVSATAVDRALVQLAERSLVTSSLNGQTMIMHPLVAQLIRDGAVRQDRITALARAAALAMETRAGALVGSEDRLAIRDLPGQVAALVDCTAGLVAETDVELAGVLRRLRFFALYHLIQLGDSASQAVTVGKQLTEDLSKVLGSDHPDTLNSRNSLAAAYQLAGQPAKAIPLYELTLHAQEQVLGPDHPDTVTSLNNLATAYRDVGRVAEAIPLFGLALATRERVLGADHPSTLNSRANLAAAFRDGGRVAEAISLFEQTLAGRERLLGSDHPDTVRSRSSLAAAYKAADRTAEAIPLVEQILTARERILGADHPKTLSSRNNLAAAYRKAGRAAEAIPLFEQTLAACERLLGVDDPRTRAARNSLAHAYQEAGQPH